MKKFRGKRRYFQTLRELARVKNSYIVLDKEDWFDFWHTHLDFKGIGNRGRKFRMEHVKAHLDFYHNLLEKLPLLEKSYQSWVFLHMDDAGQDAVFVHTPNPNAENFPYQNDDINWGCPIPDVLKDFVDRRAYHIGFEDSPYGQAYYIQAKSQGVPLLKMK